MSIIKNHRADAVDLFFLRTTRGALYLTAFSLPLSIAVSQMAIAAAFFSWFFRLTVTGTAKIPKLGLELFLLLFVAAEVIATFFAVDTWGSFFHLKRLLLILVIYLWAAHATDDGVLRRLALVFFAGMAVYALSGIVWYQWHPGQRVNHLHHFMTAGGITMLGATAGIAFALRAPARKERWLFASGSLAILACLLLTNTRGSWLGFFFALSFMLFITRRKWLWLVPLLLMAFYLLSPQAFQPRLRHFFDPEWRTNAKRLYWWQVGWEIFKDHPVVGIGDVNTARIYRQYAAPDHQERLNHFHSNYVHVGVTLGAFGLMAYLSMMGAILIRLLQGYRALQGVGRWPGAWSLAALAAFLAFNLNGFFEWNFGDAEVVTIMWFFTGTGLAAAKQTIAG